MGLPLPVSLFLRNRGGLVIVSGLSRNTLFTFCSLLYTLNRGTGSVDLGDTLCLNRPLGVKAIEKVYIARSLILLNKFEYVETLNKHIQEYYIS